MKIDGSCHCGHITYRAEVDPDMVDVCHCTDCQSVTGSAFSWAVHTPEEDFELLSGTPKTYVKTADSGATNHQVFCPECASPLYSTSLGDGPKFLNLRLGTARQRDQLQPKFQYWCRSAQSWAMELDPVRQLDTQ